MNVDVQQRERLTPIQNIMQYRTPSPASATVSTTSLSSRKSRPEDTTFETSDGSRMADIDDISSSSEHKNLSDYGRFYNNSYLKMTNGSITQKTYKIGPSINPSINTKNHFHRPGQFSYSHKQEKPVKKSTGLMSALGDKSHIIRRKMVAGAPMNNKEAINLSKFPNAKPIEPDELAPIERSDWPAPPEPAVAHPELLRSHPLGQGKAVETDIDSDEENEKNKSIDPKLQKEINELTKIQRSSMSQIIKKELEKRSAEKPRMDPRSASRVPAADHEPHYKTRFDSPIFASPSRDLAYRPRLHSMDDQMIGKKYRTLTLPIGNFPAIKPGYGLAKSERLKPEHRGRYNLERGYYTDGEYQTDGNITDEQIDIEPDSSITPYLQQRPYLNVDSRAQVNGHDTSLQNGSLSDSQSPSSSSQPPLTRRLYHTSASSMEDYSEGEYDSRTGLKRGSRIRTSKLSNNLSGIYKTDEPPILYPFDQLKITNQVLPPGVDKNKLENHLSDEEFESIFHMGREQFNKMAEWRKNDLKRKVLLY